eukprot:Amastigsp_a843318_215.p4 type:complete len:133 gc:universal Amastigsp_a843318_215:634-1032(+)
MTTRPRYLERATSLPSRSRAVKSARVCSAAGGVHIRKNRYSSLKSCEPVTCSKTSTSCIRSPMATALGRETWRRRQSQSTASEAMKHCGYLRRRQRRSEISTPPGPNISATSAASSSSVCSISSPAVSAAHP